LKTSEEFKKWVKEIWPQERDIFERPERIKYLRRTKTPDHCVFCESLDTKSEQSELLLYTGKTAMVVLNKYPYNTGHCLVLPKRHIDELTALTKDEVAEIAQLQVKVVEILGKAYEPQGYNLGMNHGKVAGAGIPDHLHWHIIPRWGGDTNFFPLIAETKVVPEKLEDSVKRLKPLFAGVKL
jgi:ATP adenylyltransferase